MASTITVLVTGGSGLVGRAVQWAVENDSACTSANENWVFLSSCDGDLRSYTATKAIFEKTKPTMIIHLAAKVGGNFANTAYPVEFLRDNLAIDQNVLGLAKEFSVKKVISCLSTCIFPDKTTYPINESMLHDGPPHHSNFGYAHAKRMLDITNRAYNVEYGCLFTSIIPTNIYGPFDNFGEGCHVIPGLIKRVCRAKAQNADVLEIPGTGRALRQFIYSRDLAKLIIWMLRHYDSCESVILSVDAQDEISIADTLKTLCFLAEYKGEIKIKKTADNSKMRSLVEDVAFTPFEEGLKESLNWYIESRKGTWGVVEKSRI